jgi:CheY-like chemotaxis protein/two-component sensor histidine kinase
MADLKIKESLQSLEGCMGEDIEKVMTTEVIHDFKNILTGILGNLALAKDWSNPEDQAYPFIEAAERVTRHANQLALQLLASARGNERIHLEFSLAKLIRDSVDLMINGSNCRTRLKINPDLKMVVGDETRITQVVNNLLVNAKQSMPGGGVITVRASNISISSESKFQIKPGKYIRLGIEDQGEGIPEENLTKIFKMHFTTKKEGSGIGLASCIYIIKNHGGTIHVESEIGKGSVFTVLLPATEIVDPDAVARDVGPLNGSGCILVMDDESMVQQTLGDMLSHFGYQVDFANDGSAAIKMYREALNSGEPYKLVIMDLTIPGGMGGMETIKHLIDLDPDVKAIVSSGHPNDPAMYHCSDYGFTASIRKPYSLRALQELLSQTISQN